MDASSPATVSSSGSSKAIDMGVLLSFVLPVQHFGQEDPGNYTKHKGERSWELEVRMSDAVRPSNS